MLERQYVEETAENIELAVVKTKKSLPESGLETLKCVKCGAKVVVGLGVRAKDVLCIEHDKSIKAL